MNNILLSAKNFVFLPKGEKKSTLRDWIETLIIAGLLALIIRTFILQIFWIPTGSMIPTLNCNDRIIGLMFTYRFREPQRGDIIIFKYPVDKKSNFIKRLVGMPGEEIKVRQGHIYINDKEWNDSIYTINRDDSFFGPVQIPPGHYFVMGDNRAFSADSRIWGFVPSHNIMGTGWLRIWPLTNTGFYK